MSRPPARGGLDWYRRYLVVMSRRPLSAKASMATRVSPPTMRRRRVSTLSSLPPGEDGDPASVVTTGVQSPPSGPASCSRSRAHRNDSRSGSLGCRSYRTRHKTQRAYGTLNPQNKTNIQKRLTALIVQDPNARYLPSIDLNSPQAGCSTTIGRFALHAYTWLPQPPQGHAFPAQSGLICVPG
jgi:hypothetical protein